MSSPLSPSSKVFNFSYCISQFYKRYLVVFIVCFLVEIFYFFTRFAFCFFAFILSRAGSLLLHRLFSGCGARASSCGGLSCGAQVLWHAGSAVVAPTLWSTGSVTGVHRLNCSKVCGIFLDQGQTSVPHWQADSLLPDQQGNMRFSIFKFVLWDFPGGSVVRNMPACRRHGFGRDPGGSHMASPLAPQLEKSPCSKKDPAEPK